MCRASYRDGDAVRGNFDSRLVVGGCFGLVVGPERDVVANVFLAGGFVNLDRDGQIPRCNAVGFEQSRFRVAGAAGHFAVTTMSERRFTPVQQDSSP